MKKLAPPALALVLALALGAIVYLLLPGGETSGPADPSASRSPAGPTDRPANRPVPPGEAVGPRVGPPGGASGEAGSRPTPSREASGPRREPDETAPGVIPSGNEASPARGLALEETSEQPAVRVTGRVVGPRGEPVPGASVLLHGFETDPSGAPSEESTDPGEAHRAETAEDGTFSLEGVRPGELTLRVDSSDHAPTWRDLRVRAGRPSEVEVRLEEGAVLSGRVESAEGGRLAGARVRLLTHPGGSPFHTDAVVRETSSGEDGVFAFEHVGEEGARILDVRAADHRPARVGLRPAQTEVNVRLESGAPIEGTVRTDAGRPVAGASVRVHDRDGVRTTTTDESGAFRLGGLDDVPHRLVVEAEGYRTARPRVTPGEGVETEVVLRRPGRIAGRVESVPEGTTGLVGLRIDGREVHTRFTAPTFEIADVPPGRHELTVELEERSTPLEATATVRPGETTTVRVGPE